MTTRTIQESKEKIAYGIVAGFVAGKVMLPLMMLAIILVGTPPEACLLLWVCHLAPAWITQY